VQFDAMVRNIEADHQAVRVSAAETIILDIQFLSTSQVACSTQRKAAGRTFSSIDIYELPKVKSTTFQNSINNSVPTLDLSSNAVANLVASFQLPSLAFPSIGGVFSSQNRPSHWISEFALQTSQTSEETSYRNTVMTFRLEGMMGAKGAEAFQGVISMFRLQNIIRSKESVIIGWDQWSSAVSIQHSQSSTVLKSRATHVAHIARPRLNNTNAIMTIRDYSQPLLLAPAGHLGRNLGNISGNVGFNYGPAEAFKVKAVPDTLKTGLFRRPVASGLGYRERTIELGPYSSDPSKSQLYWRGATTMMAVCNARGVSPLVAYLAEY